MGDTGNLYVILFSSGVIKVGRSRTGDGSRELQHQKLAINMGLHVDKTWSSPLVKDHVAVLERILIGWGHLNGCPRSDNARCEYFDGLKFDQTVAYAKTLTAPFEIGPDDEIEEDSVRDRDKYYRDQKGADALVYQALSAGNHGTPMTLQEETGLPHRTVNHALKRLFEQELITQDKPRHPWRLV